MTTTSLILFGTIIWLPFLIYAMNANETKFKKNIVVGVTFPYYAREDAEVQEHLKRFKRETLIACLLMVAIAIPCLFIGDSGYLMSAYCTWVLVAIIVPYVPYVLCNRDLKRIKKARGWAKETETEPVTVDLSVMEEERWIAPVAFAPALVVCLLPLLWERAFWLGYLCMALTCLMMWAIYRFCYRNKAETVDDNAELTKALTRIRRYHWSKAFAVMTYMTALMSVVMSFSTLYPAVTFALTLVLTAVMVVFAIRTEFHLRKLQERLTRDSGQGYYVDDDDKWIGGLLYYNPQDARLIINHRTGMNTTVNLAHPAGIALTIIGLILLLSLPLMGPIFHGVERQAIVLSVEEDVLRAKSGMAEYKVPVEDIASVTLLDALPEKFSRVMGSGFDRRISGRFTSPATGPVQVLADPTVPPYLLIETSGGSYLFGSKDGADVRAMYERLK